MFVKLKETAKEKYIKKLEKEAEMEKAVKSKSKSLYWAMILTQNKCKVLQDMKVLKKKTWERIQDSANTSILDLD